MNIEVLKIDEERIAKVMVFFSNILRAQQSTQAAGSTAARMLIVEQLIAVAAVYEDSLRRLPLEAQEPIREHVKRILDAIDAGEVKWPPPQEPIQDPTAAPALTNIPKPNLLILPGSGKN
jgi:hypothetical protein